MKRILILSVGRGLKREGDTASEKIELFEEMISIVPKDKGTDHLQVETGYWPPVA